MSPTSPFSALPPEKSTARRVILLAAWALAIALGALRMWANRYVVDPDTISYLDMADAYLRGDWPMALNGWWNPLYTWLLCLMQVVARPDPLSEYTAFHVVNFLIYVAGLGCVHFLLRQMALLNRRRDLEPRWSGTTRIAEGALYTLGFALYVWTSLDLIRFEQGADLLLASFVYLAFGLLFWIAREPRARTPHVLLGLTLAGGYLTKAVMMPVAFLFLAASLIVGGQWRAAIPGVALAGVVFALVASPFIAALSLSKGRLTYGDTGKSNYALYITMQFENNWSPPFFHWQGEVPGAGTPDHPTRRILEDPDIYEFATPYPEATYGAWYDPSHWYKGIVPTFNAGHQLRMLRVHGEHYFKLFFARQPALVSGFLILLFLGWAAHRAPIHLASLWLFLIPTVGALGLYAIVHVEDRFVGAFVSVVWLVLFGGVHVRATRESKRSATAVTASVAVAIVLSKFLPGAIDDARTLIRGEQGADEVSVRVAEKLAGLGIAPGTKVAHIGNTFYAMWARPARVHIVAEVTQKDAADFWDADAAARQRAREAFASAGAVAVLTDMEPPEDEAADWIKVDPEAKAHLRFLHPRHAAAPKPSEE